MLKILIAPDSFKESLSSIEVADCIEQGLKRVIRNLRTIKMPLADGGTGTVDAIIHTTGGKLVKCKVTGPLGEKISAKYGLINSKTAIIEMAQASGLHLIPKDKRNPMKTTTYGTGQLIKHAILNGCKDIIIGIGGSATVDGGIGMAQALGGVFLDKNGKELKFGGGELTRLRRIGLSKLNCLIKNVKFTVMTDVKNPLLGKNGAARVYGPQKGATPEMVDQLEKGLRNLADIILKDLKKDVRNIPGAGAAGGLGAGLVAFLNAQLVPGVEFIMKLINFERYLQMADLVITGEGKIDKQTLYGKTVFGVIKIARKHKKPVICIAGSVSPEATVLYNYGVVGLFDVISSPMETDYAIKNAKMLLTNTAENVGYILKNLYKWKR